MNTRLWMLMADRYLIAAELVGKTMTAMGVDDYCVVKTVKGGELAGNGL